MKDGRTLGMLALTILVAVLAGVYLFANGEGQDGGWVLAAGAALLLLLLVVVSAGASRRRRVVRDAEDRGEGAERAN